MASREQHSLYEAITRNNLDDFRAILATCWAASGIAIVPRDRSFRVTPLSYACALARGEMVLSLMRTAPDREICYAFPFAVSHKSGNVDMVREFIRHGVNVNSVWNDEDAQCYTTPLLSAIRIGNYELVKYLIECGADINPFDPDREVFVLSTAMTSCEDGEPTIITFLIKNGVDVNENKGETLFTIFENALNDHNWEEIFDLCIDHGAKLYTYPYMYFACKSGNTNMVKYLIARGLAADSEVRYNGHTALHIASCAGMSESSLVEILLKWGADPNAQVTAVGDDLYDTFLVGFSALHYACSQGDLEKLELLLDYGADVHSVNCSNVSVLFQLLDAVCKDKALYEYMVFSSEHFADDSTKRNIDVTKAKAEARLLKYTKMTKLLLASGAKLIGDEWLIDYNKPYVVMSVDVLAGSSDFLSRTRSLIEYAKYSLMRPRSLTDLCRTTIRSLLPVHRRNSAINLQGILPKSILSVLLFEDILT